MRRILQQVRKHKQDPLIDYLAWQPQEVNMRNKNQTTNPAACFRNTMSWRTMHLDFMI